MNKVLMFGLIALAWATTASADIGSWLQRSDDAQEERRATSAMVVQDIVGFMGDREIITVKMMKSGRMQDLRVQRVGTGIVLRADSNDGSVSFGSRLCDQLPDVDADGELDVECGPGADQMFRARTHFVRDYLAARAEQTGEVTQTAIARN